MGFLGFGRDRTFFRLPESQASLALEAAELLQKLLTDLGQTDELARQIGELESKADAVVHELSNRVDGAFVTPLDKEDLHALASSLDDILDAIDDTAACVRIYRLREGRADLPAFTAKLVRAVTAVRDGVNMIKLTPGREDMLQILTDIHTLEADGDTLFRQALATLFDGHASDPLYVVKWKDVYEWLESVFDACERVGTVLETIAVKYA